jgi:Plasmid recombination enzyme
MPGIFVARVQRLKKSNVAGSVKHQFRLQNTPNADPSKRHLNVDFGPQTPAEMYAAVDAVYKKNGIEPDPNKTYLAEILISSSHGALDDKTAAKMFADARKELEKKYGKENVIGGSMQFDETTPHACFYVVPIAYRETRTVKKSVIAKGTDPETGKRNRVLKEVEVKGGAHQSYKGLFGGSKYNLSDWQTEMHEKIGKKYGLERGVKGSRARHQTIADFYKTLERLKTPNVKIQQLPQRNFRDQIFREDFLKRHFKSELQKVLDVYAPIHNKVVNFTAMQQQIKTDKQRLEAAAELQQATENALAVAVEQIEVLFAENKSLLGALGKIQKAYDAIVVRLKELNLFEAVTQKASDLKNWLSGDRPATKIAPGLKPIQVKKQEQDQTTDQSFDEPSI